MHGSDLNSLQKVIPKSILPLEYGGTAGTLQEINSNYYKLNLYTQAIVFNL